jgi:hypothetical protein
VSILRAIAEEIIQKRRENIEIVKPVTPCTDII